MKSVLLLSSTALFFYVSAQTSLPCTKSSEKKLDNFFAKLVVIGNSGRQFPENITKLAAFCEESYGMVDKIENHNKRCNNKIIKQVMSMSVYTSRQQMNLVCKPSKRQKDLLDSFPCANRANNEMDKCMTKLIDAMIGAQNAEDKFKIPIFCCEYHKFEACSRTSYENTRACSSKNTDVLLQLMDGLTANVLTLLCGDYEESSDKCNALIVPKKLKSQKRSKSFFIPLVNLLLSFKDEE